jgi:hypothetical protein
MCISPTIATTAKPALNEHIIVSHCVSRPDWSQEDLSWVVPGTMTHS